MSIRTLLRYRAHANMKQLGLSGVNKKPKIGKDRRSFFSRYWREYIRLEDVKRGKRRRRSKS